MTTDKQKIQKIKSIIKTCDKLKIKDVQVFGLREICYDLTPSQAIKAHNKVFGK